MSDTQHPTLTQVGWLNPATGDVQTLAWKAKLMERDALWDRDEAEKYTEAVYVLQAKPGSEGGAA